MRVLLVEDDQAQRELVSINLEEAGHEVRCTDRGADVPGMYKEWQPDWLVLDMKMPDLGGLAVLELLRREGIRPRAILWTAYLTSRGAAEVLEQTRHLGAETYIEKGELGENLLEWIRSHPERRREQRVGKETGDD